jgi:hypothetical protein
MQPDNSTNTDESNVSPDTIVALVTSLLALVTSAGTVAYIKLSQTFSDKQNTEIEFSTEATANGRKSTILIRLENDERYAASYSSAPQSDGETNNNNNVLQQRVNTEDPNNVVIDTLFATGITKAMENNNLGDHIIGQNRHDLARDAYNTVLKLEQLDMLNKNGGNPLDINSLRSHIASPRPQEELTEKHSGFKNNKMPQNSHRASVSSFINSSGNISDEKVGGKQSPFKHFKVTEMVGVKKSKNDTNLTNTTDKKILENKHLHLPFTKVAETSVVKKLPKFKFTETVEENTISEKVGNFLSPTSSLTTIVINNSEAKINPIPKQKLSSTKNLATNNNTQVVVDNENNSNKIIITPRNKEIKQPEYIAINLEKEPKGKGKEKENQNKDVVTNLLNDDSSEVIIIGDSNESDFS